MKRTVFFLIAVAAAYVVGLVHGDMASRAKRITIDMGRKENAARARDGDYEFTSGRSEDGRDVTIVWHR